MIIDTAAKAKTYRITSRLISLISLITFAAVLITFPAYGEFPWDRDLWLIIIALTYGVIIALRFLLSPYYVYVSDEGATLQFKYFTLHPFLIQKYAIEIPKAEFAGYEFKRTNLGLILAIKLQRNHKGKIVDYPLIRISLLNKTERKKLVDMLTKYSGKTVL